jgi:hypothetical protein
LGIENRRHLSQEYRVAAGLWRRHAAGKDRVPFAVIISVIFSNDCMLGEDRG